MRQGVLERPGRRYSAFSLLSHGVRKHRWPRVLADDEPRAGYDAVIIGAGGHGLAAAHHLARDHGMTDIAVVDKGYLGGGNITRNTAIVRSNYFGAARGDLSEQALRRWEQLSDELNYNVMFSARGILNLAHSDAQLDDYVKRANAMALRGVEARLVSRDEIARRIPRLDLSRDTRHPIVGGLVQERAGVVRHDAVAWGYARSAASRGAHIIQHCAVTGIRTVGDRVVGLDTSRGQIDTDRVIVAASAGTAPIAAMAGLRLPIENHLLQAAVTEPLAPVLDMIVTHGMVNCYISQTDKGELLLGGNIDGYNNHSSIGTSTSLAEVLRTCVTMFPSFASARLLRSWGGSVDMSMDGQPILSKTPIGGLYLNAGWCYGGLKTTPMVGVLLAEMAASNRTPQLAAPFSLDRFTTGHVVQEEGYGPKPWKYH